MSVTGLITRYYQVHCSQMSAKDVKNLLYVYKRGKSILTFLELIGFPEGDALTALPLHWSLLIKSNPQACLWAEAWNALSIPTNDRYKVCFSGL